MCGLLYVFLHVCLYVLVYVLLHVCLYVRGCEDFTEEERETGGYFGSVEATPHCSTRGLIHGHWSATLTYIYLQRRGNYTINLKIITT